MEQQEVVFHIEITEDRVYFKQKQNTDCLFSHNSSGLMRKAKMSQNKREYVSSQPYEDLQFPPPQRPGVKYVRLFDFFEESSSEPLLFPVDENRSSFIKQAETYPSFLAESGVISYKYLRTLFITQQISRNGFYQYFVKRNGQYFIQNCDDLIPVDAKTKKPLYGLSIKHPWQIILMKAWLKEMGGWYGFDSAEAFRFLDAFGLPQYKTFYFKKELDFLEKEKVPMKNRQENIENFSLNRPNVIIIAQAKNNPSLQQIGLVPGAAAYKIMKSSHEQYYRLYSSLPCKWVGKLTPIEKTKLNDLSSEQIKENRINLERTFLITEEEVLNYFGKCYVVPNQATQVQNYNIQFSMDLQATKNKPIWIKFDCKSNKTGLLAFSIQMERSNNRQEVYPQVKYFLSKLNNAEEIRNSHIRNDIRQSKMKDNQYVESTCDKWSYVAIDYDQGYHHSSAHFGGCGEGEYILFLEFSDYTPFKLRFDSAVPLTEPQITELPPEEQKIIFDSTFFDVARNISVETYFDKKTKDESIMVSNSFDEFGFGAIIISTLVKARHQVGMRIYPNELKRGGYDLCDHLYKTVANRNQDSGDKNIVLVSKKGKPEIIVLRRTDEKKKTTIDEQFPPPNSIQFFKITPNSELGKSRMGKSQSKVGKSRSKSRIRQSKVK